MVNSSSALSVFYYAMSPMLCRHICGFAVYAGVCMWCVETRHGVQSILGVRYDPYALSIYLWSCICCLVV